MRDVWAGGAVPPARHRELAGDGTREGREQDAARTFRAAHGANAQHHHADEVIQGHEAMSPCLQCCWSTAGRALSLGDGGLREPFGTGLVQWEAPGTPQRRSLPAVGLGRGRATAGGTWHRGHMAPRLPPTRPGLRSGCSGSAACGSQRGGCPGSTRPCRDPPLPVTAPPHRCCCCWSCRCWSCRCCTGPHRWRSRSGYC